MRFLPSRLHTCLPFPRGIHHRSSASFLPIVGQDKVPSCTHKIPKIRSRLARAPTCILLSGLSLLHCAHRIKSLSLSLSRAGAVVAIELSPPGACLIYSTALLTGRRMGACRSHSTGTENNLSSTFPSPLRPTSPLFDGILTLPFLMLVSFGHIGCGPSDLLRRLVFIRFPSAPPHSVYDRAAVV